MRVRILIVDDSPMVRKRLAMLLQQHDDWQVCGEAVNGFEAVRKAEQLDPDLIVMDFLMPGMNGLQAAREIGQKIPSIPILMFTMHMSNQLVQEAKNAGVKGAVAKTDVGGMIEGVESLLRHKPYFGSS
jgi:DNA-binding NarL/FixJ family response regulator